MKDKSARVLAIIALVFMGIFVVTLTMTLIDYRMLNGSIGFVALGSGVFAIMIYIALKADGRGFSITKMNNEIEMEKIKKELEEKGKEDGQTTEPDTAEANADSADENAENAEKDEHK